MSNTIENLNCGGCFFYSKNRCHRYPPRIVPEKSVGDSIILHQNEVMFPKVHVSDYCGEWRSNNG